MATYFEMIAQIEDLKKQAERQRKEEYNSVIKTIKKQISDYGITAQELGFGGVPITKRGHKPGKTPFKAGRKAGKKRANLGIKIAPKYRDENGNTWSGRGKQPKWLVTAIATGRSLDSLLIRS